MSSSVILDVGRMSARVLQTISDKLLGLRESFHSEMSDLERLCRSFEMGDQVPLITGEFNCVFDRIQVKVM